MSNESRNEAKRVRRLKRKQNSSDSDTNNRISAAGFTIVGGGILAAGAIALGINALSPGGPSDASGDSPAPPIDSSQSPTPSASATTQPE